MKPDPEPTPDWKPTSGSRKLPWETMRTTAARASSLLDTTPAEEVGVAVESDTVEVSLGSEPPESPPQALATRSRAPINTGARRIDFPLSRPRHDNRPCSEIIV